MPENTSRVRLSNGAALALLLVFASLPIGYGFFVHQAMFGDDDPVAEVNDGADWLLKTGAWRQLERVADELMDEPPGDLPYFVRWDEAPASVAARLPSKFWRLGGHTPTAPTYVLIVEGKVMFSWARFANASHDVHVFARPPASAPKGVFGRIVSDRTFIVSRHCSQCDDNPASEARRPPDDD